MSRTSTCAGRSAGTLALPHKFPAPLRAEPPVAQVFAHVDDDQTLRYSPASGDPTPIYLDEDTAKAAGLPGITSYAFETRVGDDVVIKDGWAEIAD